MLPFKPSPTTLPLALFFLLQILQVTGMCDPTREKGKDQATKYKEEKRPKMRRFVRLCWWVRGVQLWQRSWLAQLGGEGHRREQRRRHGSTMAVTNRPPCLPPPRGLQEHISRLRRPWSLKSQNQKVLDNTSDQFGKKDIAFCKTKIGL